jgi:hypothetical protein
VDTVQGNATGKGAPVRGLRRKAAAQYLKNVHGIPVSYSGLAKAAVRGDGPPYRLWGKIPIYDPPGLDAFAESRIGPEVRCTAEYAAPGKHPGRPGKSASSTGAADPA